MPIDNYCTWCLMNGQVVKLEKYSSDISDLNDDHFDIKCPIDPEAHFTAVSVSMTELLQILVDRSRTQVSKRMRKKLIKAGFDLRHEK